MAEPDVDLLMMPDVEPDAADALGALAPLFRVRPEFQVLCRFGASWASAHDQEPSGQIPFHLVTRGACVLDVAGTAEIRLEAGDIAMLPYGDVHTVRSEAASTSQSGCHVTHAAPIDIRSNTDAPDVELICGRFTFEQAHDNFARAALPRLIRVSTLGTASAARMGVLLLAIRDELAEGRSAARAIASDLASGLFLMVLRRHFETHAAEGGLLRLLERRSTARAVTAMLEDPARAWSLDDLAAAALTSRATLVRDFRRLAQTSPFDVLAALRLGLARHQLATSKRPLADIAFEAGYQSQSAFSRAFQRHFGLAPGATRSAAPSPAAAHA